MDTDLDQATAIRYGDVFTVQGDLAGKPVAPGDAAALQAAEARVLGRTPRSGPGAVMGSAATVNYHAGAVDRNQTTDSVRDQGVSVSVADVAGVSVVTETVAGQVMSRGRREGRRRRYNGWGGAGGGGAVGGGEACGSSGCGGNTGGGGEGDTEQ
ncbi:Late embryogenesis abundant protein D-34 [Linum grandiflorum]